MKHSESSFVGSKNLKIYYQCWLPDSPKAAVVMIHGLGEHSGRYAHVAAELLDIGCAVYALDHRGHGKSDGPRALVDRFKNAVADMDTLIERVRREQPRRPLILLGHSMGGALALSYTIKHGDKLSALALSAPAVALDGALPMMKPIARVLSAIAPKLGMFAIDPGLVSRDPATVADYAADPLNAHGKVPARTLGEIVKFVDVVPGMLFAIKLPVLLMHGSEDKLAGLAGSQMVFDRISSTDKTLKIYDGFFHEIFNEPPADRARVLKDLRTWIEAHV